MRAIGPVPLPISMALRTPLQSMASRYASMIGTIEGSAARASSPLAMVSMNAAPAAETFWNGSVMRAPSVGPYHGSSATPRRTPTAFRPATWAKLIEKAEDRRAAAKGSGFEVGDLILMRYFSAVLASSAHHANLSMDLDPWIEGLSDSATRIDRMDESSIDRETMGRLAKVLAFIGSPDDPVVVALRQAAETGAGRDIKQARTLFLKLKPADRRAALASLIE